MGETFWRRMWAVAVWHNVIAALVLIIFRDQIYTGAGLEPPVPGLHYDTWIGLVCVFGLVYYMVYADLYGSRGLVFVGIAGKITSATPQLIYLLALPGEIPKLFAIPVFTDYAFAILYIMFLRFLTRSGKERI